MNDRERLLGLLTALQNALELWQTSNHVLGLITPKHQGWASAAGEHARRCKILSEAHTALRHYFMAQVADVIQGGRNGG